MDQQTIPSSAFIKIGQKLIATPILQVAAPEPTRIVDSEMSIYDIWKEWASLLVEYFGEYI